ncbi:MAG: hypothetical protein JWM46_186 [Candidatus Kaiserbacteria bacterium]|nr:hypothetical protein [Candidatus Kaiserbacteria bacterium]
MVNFGELYRVLVNEIGQSRTLAFAPVMTAHPERINGGNALAKQLAGAGFEIVSVASLGQADDMYLKDRINALDPGLVSEIVLFTSDKDFVPVLRAKKSQGVRIHWVSTKQPDPGLTRHSLSEDTLQMFASGEFHFTDLAPFKQRLTFMRGLGQRPCAPCIAISDSITEISVTLNSTDPMEHRRLMSELQRIKTSFKGFTIKAIR